MLINRGHHASLGICTGPNDMNMCPRKSYHVIIGLLLFGQCYIIRGRDLIKAIGFSVEVDLGTSAGWSGTSPRSSTRARSTLS